MGCACSKGTRVTDYIENNNVKERRNCYIIPKRRSSSSKKNGVPKETSVNGNDSSLSLLPCDAKNASLTPVSSNEELQKINLEKKTSKSVFHRRPMLEINGGNNSGSFQPRMTRINSVSNGEKGAQIMAGWPSWLAAVAGEAINGWIPRKPDSFEKLEKIGQGTYSSVYKARDMETNQIVALKKVRFANMDPDSVRFMAREIIILRRLDHPNVMKLEGLITSRVSGSMYLIFEYMDHDLAGLATSPGIKFSEAQIKCYMKQLFNGLEHCHSRGVLHRDIKGSNLLLDHNNNLKIGDFGLANFYGEQQKQSLTSRVVTLWYRAPELLLGSTDYGVTVDMWSTGCILAELFTGKPIMPGRTEVEQLHKIFKLCGSPSDEYWKKSKLPHATSFKPQHPYKRCVAETFKALPSSALALVEVLLAVEPDARGTTSQALQSEFFTTEPFASDPSSLPRYQPRKEYDVKLRDEETKRNKGTSSKQIGSKQVSRESKAVPAANAELLTSLQKRQGQNNQTNSSENFMEPLKRTSQNGNDLLMDSSRSPPRKELRKQRSYVQRRSAQLSKFSNSVAAKDGSRLAIGNSNHRRHNAIDDGDWSQRLLPKIKGSNFNQPSIMGEKTERMQYSGPLVPAGGGNLDEMLKEHERKIRSAVRKVRPEKKTKKDKKMKRDNDEVQSNMCVVNGR